MKLPDYVPVGQFPKTPLRELFTAASVDCLNLLSKCLLYDPRKRISAKEVYIFHLIGPTHAHPFIGIQALDHPYFFALPYPSHPSKLPKPVKKESTMSLDEMDGNLDLNGPGPAGKVKAALG